jgi:Mce-associated membrane protein
MATERKTAREDQQLSWGDSTDEDVLPPVAPSPTLPQEKHSVFPVWAWIAIAAALVLIQAAASVFLFRSNAPEHNRNDALSLSRRFVISLTTYSESSLASQRTTVLSMSTGTFRADFDRLTGSSFADALHQTQASSQGKIVTLAVSSAASDHATVLGIVDVTVSNKDLKTPRVDRQVIQIALVRTSSGWKVDGVTVLGRLS